MKVFLSWSGDASRRVAEALREWLPNVIQAIEPWMSAEDIEKGARWSSDIATELAKTKAGIVCVTPSNQEAPWLNFEAGALSKTVDKSMVCPFLVGIRPADMKGPLVQFQAAEATQGDVRKLLATLNKALEKDALAERQLAKTFDIWWPELDRALKEIGSDEPKAAPMRPERELLEEILGVVREQAKQPANVVVLSSGLSGRSVSRWLSDSPRESGWANLLRHSAPNTKFLLVDDWHQDIAARAEGTSTQETGPTSDKTADGDDSTKKKGGA